ncbi:ABC transporter substrate-binding protein [Paraburkholderia fungorum]|uniref:ABC transporter substrate-binding protein n=1 Tax=Paraburkholderia fungorum TaxID=134537 RepID=UPI0038B99CC6
MTALTIACLASSFPAHAKEWTTIRFATDASYPPFESKAPNGSLVGFDIDLGNEICARIHARCVWIENSFDGMIPGLKARKFDAVLSSMTMTPKREEQIGFSVRLYNTGSRLIVAKGSNLQPTAESLAGKSVGVEQGTIQEIYARTCWEPKGTRVVAYQNQDQVYADLMSGRLDAVLQNQVQADLGFLKTPRGANFTFAGTALNDPKILGKGTGIGMRKEDTDLKADIDDAIAGMLRDGTYLKIAKKYFDFNIYGE